MRGKRLNIGSIAILFTVVMLCVSIFAALTVATAAAEARTARQYADYVQRLNQCEAAGQQWLAEADGWTKGLGPLPEGAQQTETELWGQVERGDMTLTIRLRLQDGGYEIAQWQLNTQWQPQQQLQLWRQKQQ